MASPVGLTVASPVGLTGRLTFDKMKWAAYEYPPQK
jgi:hypothetical protein